jgi:hypothetical protein
MNVRHSGRLRGGFDVRSGNVRLAASRTAAGFAAFVGLYAVAAFAFYSLMQPAVITNRGMAAYQAPPKAVVSYVPWVPPAPDTDAPVVLAQPAPALEQTNVAPPKTDTKTHYSRRAAAAPRERHVRARPVPRYSYDVGRSFAFRPWF